MVSPDPKRRLLSRAGDRRGALHARPGCPSATASPPRTARKGTAYYTFDKGLCRFVVLDTVNPNGYADGSIDQAQFDWLKTTLAALRRTGS